MIKKLKTWTIGSLSEQASKAAVYFMILTVCSPAEVNQYSLYLLLLTMNYLTQLGIQDRLFLNFSSLLNKRAYNFYFYTHLSILLKYQWLLQSILLIIFIQAYGLNILNAIFAIISISLLQFFNFTITRIRYQNKILVATRKRIYLSFARLLLIPLVVLNFDVSFIILLEGIICLPFINLRKLVTVRPFRSGALSSFYKFIKRNKLLMTILGLVTLGATLERNLSLIFFEENFLIFMTSLSIFTAPVVFFVNQFISILGQEFRNQKIVNRETHFQYFGSKEIYLYLMNIFFISTFFIYLIFEHTYGGDNQDVIILIILCICSKLAELVKIASFYNLKNFSAVIKIHLISTISVISWYFIGSYNDYYSTYEIVIMGFFIKFLCVIFFEKIGIVTFGLALISTFLILHLNPSSLLSDFMGIFCCVVFTLFNAALCLQSAKKNRLYHIEN